MTISKTAGTRRFIGPVVNPDLINAMTDEDAVAFFEAIPSEDWIEIEEIEDHGEYGDTSESITFTSTSNRRVRKMKGPRNAGTQALVVGADPLDDGQNALLTAESTDFNYAFKAILADKRDAGHSNSNEYYAGLVMSKSRNVGNATNVLRRTFNIDINTAIFEVGSAALSAPTNTLKPAISGTPAIGQVLTAFEGKWTGSPTFSFVWNRSGTPIAGATARTYTVQALDEGDDITVTVTGTNTAGSASATSMPTIDIPA